MHSINTKRIVLGLAAGMAMSLAGTAGATDKGKAYFNGKTVEWIVATAPGGGHDFWGRLVAGSMQKQLPGSTFVVKNRPGAGHVIGANLIYNAKPNGLTLGNFTTGLLYSSLLKTKGIRFDLAKMSWLGKVTSERRVLSVGQKSEFKSFQDMIDSKRIIKFSATGVGSNTHTEAFLLGTAFKIPFRIITGYTSSSAALAILRGEIDAMTGGEDSAASYEKAGHIRNVMMIGAGKPGVVDAADYAKTPLAKSVVRLMGAMGTLSRIMAGPPAIPADRLAALRTAFRESLESPSLQAAAKKAGRGIEPAYGDDVGRLVAELMDQPPEVVAMLNELSKVRVAMVKHEGKVTQTKRGGRQVFISHKGKEVWAKISGSRTKVTVNGKPAKRKAIKVGMTCAFSYPRANAEAKKVDCRK